MATEEVRYVEYGPGMLPAVLKAQVLSFLRIVWPEGFTGGLRYRDWITNPAYEPHHLLYVAGDLVVSHLEIVHVDLHHNGTTYQAAAPTSVLTFPSFRDEGWAGRLVATACRRIESSNADLGLICCDPHNQPFYTKTSGWPAIPEARIIADEAPTSQAVLLRLLSPEARAHEPDFRTSPIHLKDEL
ncbi:GNAT family N-acetyltransferase [Kribbella sp. NPDC003505]|uniref:GNAT family N-acetyltransferase n=1 Tax=Kribbella sp. NPDC003505 TaxID=3154448 RepID=UPI0033A26E6C